jgi:hypothetical protein
MGEAGDRIINRCHRPAARAGTTDHAVEAASGGPLV